jgi:hypothetical protein
MSGTRSRVVDVRDAKKSARGELHRGTARHLEHERAYHEGQLGKVAGTAEARPQAPRR